MSNPKPTRGIHLEPYVAHWNRVTPEDLRRIKLSCALAHTKHPRRKVPVSLPVLNFMTKDEI